MFFPEQGQSLRSKMAITPPRVILHFVQYACHPETQKESYSLDACWWLLQVGHAGPARGAGWAQSVPGRPSPAQPSQSPNIRPVLVNEEKTPACWRYSRVVRCRPCPKWIMACNS